MLWNFFVHIFSLQAALLIIFAFFFPLYLIDSLFKGAVKKLKVCVFWTFKESV